MTLIGGVSNIVNFFVFTAKYNVSKSIYHNFFKTLNIPQVIRKNQGLRQQNSILWNFIMGKVNITVTGLGLYSMVAKILPTVCQSIHHFSCYKLNSGWNSVGKALSKALIKTHSLCLKLLLKL